MGNRVLDPSTGRQTTPPTTVPMEPPKVPMQPPTVPMETPTVPMRRDYTEIQPGIPMQQEDFGMTSNGPPPSTEPGYIPYYLLQNIGKNVRAEFIIGSNQYSDKTGVLSEVGINYFVLRDVNSRTNIMCDLYSVKFVTVLD
jgi:hypothetical protein